MARIRTIKPEFWTDEKLGPLDPPTRLVFLGLISMADDAGRVLDSLKQIDAFIFPYTDDSARSALSTLAELGRVRRGKNRSGLQVIQIVNWHHQKIDKPNWAASLLPLEGDPDDGVIRWRRSMGKPTPTGAGERGRVDEESTNERRRVSDESTPHINIPTTHIPTTHIPTTHIPTTHLPTTHLPTTHIPTTHIPTTHIQTTHEFAVDDNSDGLTPGQRRGRRRTLQRQMDREFEAR